VTNAFVFIAGDVGISFNSYMFREAVPSILHCFVYIFPLAKSGKNETVPSKSTAAALASSNPATGRPFNPIKDCRG
jgi:hypothetical protein